jgi:metal-responsive CopG/Arc/MetJ family transcriptional regulator
LAGVARREIIVQLDDGLVAALDRVAREEGLSRSELLRRAAAALLEARRIGKEERRLVEAYRRIPQDPLVVEAAARLAAQTTPPW